MCDYDSVSLQVRSSKARRLVASTEVSYDVPADSWSMCRVLLKGTASHRQFGVFPTLPTAASSHWSLPTHPLMTSHPRVPSWSALLANIALSTQLPSPKHASILASPSSAQQPASTVDWVDPNAVSSLRALNERLLSEWRQAEQRATTSTVGEESKVGAFDAFERLRSAEWARGVRSYVDPFSDGRRRSSWRAVRDAREDDEEERRWTELERRERREHDIRQNKEERKEQQLQPVRPATSAPRPARLSSSLSTSTSAATAIATAGSSSSSLSASSGRRDFRWLLARCESVTHAGSALTALDVASSTLHTLQSNRSDDQLQSDLLDLLGMEGIELVGELLQHRHELRKATVTDLERTSSPQPAAYSSAPRAAPPQLLGVSVTSQRAKDAAKAQRKEDRRMARLSSKDTSVEFVARQQQADAERLEEQARSLDQWRSAAVTERSTALPAGSQRTEHKGYEEVYIPPTLPAHFNKDELVPIQALEPWARPVFGTTTHLNRIQSKCYQVAYKHNNNLLVCAPTGAGQCSLTSSCTPPPLLARLG